LGRQGIQGADEAQLEQIVLSQRERVKTVREMALNSMFFFRAPVDYDEKAVRKHVTADVLALLGEFSSELAQLADWTAPAIHQAISGFAAVKGTSLGKIAQPIRLAMCGGTISPPIDATLAVLGKAETLARLARAQANWRVVNPIP
jgi:glutamyl-tRNA synthetase